MFKLTEAFQLSAGDRPAQCIMIIDIKAQVSRLPCDFVTSAFPHLQISEPELELVYVSNQPLDVSGCGHIAVSCRGKSTEGLFYLVEGVRPVWP